MQLQFIYAFATLVCAHYCEIAVSLSVLYTDLPLNFLSSSLAYASDLYNAFFYFSFLFLPLLIFVYVGVRRMFRIYYDFTIILMEYLT